MTSEVSPLPRIGKCFLLLAVGLCALLAEQGVVSALSRAQQLPLRGVCIVLDPGHGGIDDGTRIAGGQSEKQINLQLALVLRETLQRMGARVIMTRETDQALSRLNKVYLGRHREDLAKRVQIIDQAGCDLFVSLHCNSAPGHAQTRGPLVYCQTGRAASAELAEKLQSRLNGMNLAPYSARQRPHQAVAADYYLLRNSSSSGVLVEVGFLSNPTDRRLLADQAFQRACANSIALGIGDYLRSEHEAEDSER